MEIKNSTVFFITQLFCYFVSKVIRAKDAYVMKKRHEWVLDWPGQTVLCISQLYWTADITKAFPKGSDGLKEYIDISNEELNQIIILVRGKLSTQNRTTLGNFRNYLRDSTLFDSHKNIHNDLT